jgi:uncharacterized protein (UPF0332 family)
MTQEERSEYARNRIETAHKTIDAAKLLAENGFWNSAVNRLYYALFYAVNALLVVNEIYPQSHSGMRSLFALHFIKTEKMDLKYGKLLAQLYDWRQKGDYDNIFDYDSESVMTLFDPVIEMVIQIEKEIKQKA